MNCGQPLSQLNTACICKHAASSAQQTAASWQLSVSGLVRTPGTPDHALAEQRTFQIPDSLDTCPDVLSWSEGFARYCTPRQQQQVTGA